MRPRSFYTKVCSECGDRVEIGLSSRELMTVCKRCKRKLEEKIAEATEDLKGENR